MDNLYTPEELEKLPLFAFFSYVQKESFPELHNCTSATEASKILYGVKGMTRFIFINPTSVQNIKSFFGTNHSDMIAWSQAIVDIQPKRVQYLWNDNEVSIDNGELYFYGSPENFAQYKQAVRDVGIKVAAKFLTTHDMGDIFTGLEYLRADKHRWKRFQQSIVAELPRWPIKARVHMIHDYAMEQMQRAERRASPKTGLRPSDRMLPAPSGIPEVCEGFKVLVPQSTADLRKIGRAQNHCVGTTAMGYANKVQSGTTYIIAFYTNSLADGICVEYGSSRSVNGFLRVVQAQGRLRRGPTSEEIVAINAIGVLLSPTFVKCF